MEMAKKDYAYAVGRIRVLETKLLPVGFFERLLNTTSLDETLRLMGETDYGSKDCDADFENILEEQLLEVYHFLRRQTSDAPELLVFLRRWDIHNLKLLVAAEAEGHPSILGVTPFEELEEMVTNSEYTELPLEFNEVLENLPEGGPERAAALDKAYYGYGRRILGKCSQLLGDYWQTRLDLINLQIFLRLRNANASTKEFFKFMVEPGIIESEKWAELFNAPYQNLALLLSNSPYQNLLRGGEEIFKYLPFLERETDNFLLEIIKEAKMISLGIEPLIGYLLAKEREVLNLRLVFAGKKNKLPAETVRRRLRNVYF